MTPDTSPGEPLYPVEHELKCGPRYFEAIIDGRKTFEVRINDRDFHVLDILWLREWDPVTGYSGRETRREISYLLLGGGFGVDSEWCVLGLRVPSTSPTAALTDVERARIREEVLEEVAGVFAKLAAEAHGFADGFATEGGTQYRREAREYEDFAAIIRALKGKVPR
jgi:hypothetical protein